MHQETAVLTVERTFTVQAPIENVFDYLADFTNTNDWDPGTVRTTRLDNGPLQVGAKFHNVSKFRGRETELDYELTVFDPRTHLTFQGTNKTVTSTDDLSFRPDGSGTRIHYAARFDFHGVAKLAQPFLSSTFETLADDTVMKMTGVLERL
jgi:carbon monoxide dehydrogenase subunit G